jgi:hypothetical protein
MREPYKVGFFWADKSPGWEIRDYGLAVEGKGDLIFNTCDKIIRDADNSDWAYAALDNCAYLLNTRKRWPERMNQSIDAKNRIDCIWSKLMRKLGVNPTHKYRWVTGMTRDPYIAFYACCVFLGNYEYIEGVTMPYYNYRRTTWRWRKLLIKDNRLDYVKRLSYLRAIAVTLKHEDHE